MSKTDVIKKRTPLVCYRVPENLSDGQLRENMAESFDLTKTESSRATCVYFDTFTRDLRDSGYLLYWADSQLVLLNAESGGPVLCEDSDRPVVDQRGILRLAEGAMMRKLGRLAPYRSFLQVAHFAQTVAAFSVLNEDRKIVVRLRFKTMSHARSGRLVACLIRVSELTGYGKEASALRSWLRERGFTEESDERMLAVDGAQTQWGEMAMAYESIKGIKQDGDSTLLEVMMDILSQTVRKLSCLEYGVIEDVDTEFLHDYRVSIRKLRSMLKLFPGAMPSPVEQRLNDDLRLLGKATNIVRDLDVYLLSKEDYLKRVPEILTPGLDEFFQLLAKRRRVAFGTLAAFLKSAEYRSIISRLEKLGDRNNDEAQSKGAQGDLLFKDQATAYIAKQYRKIVRRVARIDVSTEDEAIHNLRIQCKRLRYAIDFGRCVLDAEAAGVFIKRFKSLQNALGRFNDESVQIEFMQNMLSGENALPPPQGRLMAGMGALIAALDQQHRQTRVAVLEQLSRMEGKKDQKRLNQLIGYV